MYGIYKDKEQLLLLRFIGYRDLDFKKLVNRKSQCLIPQLRFSMKGILLIYDLKGCYLEKDQLFRHQEPVGLLRLWKSST